MADGCTSIRRTTTTAIHGLLQLMIGSQGRDTVIANDAAVALWMIQEIQAGEYGHQYLTAGLLTTAGVSSGYTGDTLSQRHKSVITDLKDNFNRCCQRV